LRILASKFFQQIWFFRMKKEHKANITGQDKNFKENQIQKAGNRS